MTNLALSLAPQPSEPAIGVASRIAMKLGISNVSDCLLDLGINWPLFRRGRPTEIEQFADIIDADGAILLHESFAPRPEGRFSFRGHLLDRPMVNRCEIRLCPLCVLEDHDRGGTLERYCRAHWQLNQLRTCPHHSVPIMTLPSPPAPHYALDFARIVERNFEIIQQAAATTVVRSHRFESWLLHRLAYQRPRHWFDELEVSVVTQLCEKAGTALCFGAAAAPRQLDSEQLATATEVAFQRLAATNARLEPLIREIWEACPSQRPGYYTAFGNLWRWLDKAKGDHRYKRVLQEMADFVFTHQSIPAGTSLLGQICKERRYHSVKSAAAAYGLNTSRTDRLLKTLIKDGQGLGVEAIDPLLSRITSCLPRVKAAKRMGVSPDMFDRLKHIGRLLPAFSGENVADLFDIKELDHLRHTIFSHAQIVHQRPPNCSRITAAAGIVSVPCEEILAMVAEGKIAFVGQEAGNHRMCDLYVNRDELRDLVHGPEEPIPPNQLTIDQTRRVLHLNTQTIAWLIRQGYLPTRRYWNERRRRHSRLIAKADVNAFANRYVSLGALAAEARIQANHVARRLERKGIIPIDFPPNLNKIFLREVVRPSEHVGRLVLPSSHK
ncbi:TniQ family protein [Paracoccus onubensis]|uniref:TniQ domain-containing protein n=1 Tax=Paracoccus onubensis TaxID=1675788 RepID=A0A418SVQ7_9RHOB|nr:TniQ family protein [Paracoccus onubensis]RJE85034.1 hypothetical protein D3P04_12140 [Paracoccus onubensis]